MKRSIFIFLLLGITLVGCNSSKNIKPAGTTNLSQETQNMGTQEIPSVKDHPLYQENIEDLFLKEWKIKKLFYLTDKPVYTVDEIDAVIGKKVIFSKEKATTFGNTLDTLDKFIENPVYNQKILSIQEFQDTYKIPFKNLNLETIDIMQIEASDANGNECVFMIKNENTLFFVGGGILLELEPIS